MLFRSARLPSSPEDEAEEPESTDGDGEEAGGESSGSDEDDDDDGSDEEVADADGDDDGEEEDDDKEEEEEEDGAERRCSRASPLPSRPKSLNLEVGTPSPSGPVGDDDATVMDVQLGTIHLAQTSARQGKSGPRGPSAPPSLQASSNGSVPQPLKRSLGYVLL